MWTFLEIVKETAGKSLLLAGFMTFMVTLCSSQTITCLANLDRFASHVYAAKNDTDLYVSGDFHNSGVSPVLGAAHINNITSTVAAMSPNPDMTASSHTNFIECSGSLFCSGNFYYFTTNTSHFARWNKGANQWDTLNRINGTVIKLYNFSDTIYAVGDFTDIDGQAMTNIARYYNSSWHAVNNFAWDNGIYCMTMFQNKIVVGGGFYNNGLNHVAILESNQWKPLQNGILGSLTSVNDLLVYNHEVYVAGMFGQSDGNLSSGIQKWDGNQWIGLGEGLTCSAQIWKMHKKDSVIYCIGTFWEFNHKSCNRFFSLNGSTFSTYNLSFGSTPLDICSNSKSLFVAGSFVQINSDSNLMRLVRIDSISKLIDSTFNYSPNYTNVMEYTRNSICIYPNPAGNSISIKSEITFIEGSSFTIENLFGQQVLSGSFTPCIDLSTIPAGYYFLSIKTTDDRVYKTKFVKQ